MATLSNPSVLAPFLLALLPYPLTLHKQDLLTPELVKTMPLLCTLFRSLPALSTVRDGAGCMEFALIHRAKFTASMSGSKSIDCSGV